MVSTPPEYIHKYWRLQGVPGQPGKRHEKRDLSATWRPTERAYRTVDVVVQSTHRRARRTTKEHLAIQKCITERHAISSFSMACIMNTVYGKDEYEEQRSLEPLTTTLHPPRIPMFNATESGR